MSEETVAPARYGIPTEPPVYPATGGVSAVPDFRSPTLHLNRELSWLEFNRRVLFEARDPRIPLLERV
jgi:hypothetical protein